MVVDPQGVDDDPHDRPEAERRSLQRGVGSLAERHRIDDERDRDRHHEGDQRRPVRLEAQHPQQYEQDEQRQDGEDRRQAQ
jgi:hypothetical protein